MKSNILKKFLRLIGTVWAIALTIIVFAVILCKSEWIVELLTSTVMVALLCLVIGGAVGFIAGAIVSYLNTANAIEAREKTIENLETANNDLRKQLNKAHADFSSLDWPQVKKSNSKILKEIEGLSIPSTEEASHDLQENSSVENV